MNIDELDLKLKLLSGEPIKVDDAIGEIKPFVIRKIVKEGYTEYMRRLNMFALEIKDLLGTEEGVEELEKEGLKVFDILVDFGGEEVERELERSLSFFLEKEAKVIKSAKIVQVRSGDSVAIIDRDGFEKVREIIKWQNCINRFGEQKSSAESTDKAKELLKKLEERKRMTEKAKRQNGDNVEGDLDISDILSAVSSKSHSINKLNIFDLTLYQLYDEFNRLELLDQYDVNIKSMLAGAQNIKLQHWSSKIDW